MDRSHKMPHEQNHQSPGVLRGLIPILVLTAVWVAMAIAVDPRGEFSLNDDWAYALPVKAVVERGSLHFTFWQSMTLITQVVWGALFCLPSGFSYLALRVSVLVAGLAGILGLYRLCRHFGTSAPLATLAAMTVALNPLYVGLSCSFMTDIPFTALLILSILGLLVGIDNGWRWAFLLGLVAGFAALYVRQLALAIFLAFAVASPIKLGFGRRWFLSAIVPLLAAGLSLSVYTRVLKHFGRLPGMYYLKVDSLNMVIRDLLHFRLGALKPVTQAAVMMLVYAGLFALPILLATWPSLVARREPKSRMLRLGWIAGFTALATAALAATGDLLPMGGNMTDDLRMGVIAIAGSGLPSAPLAYWVALTAAGTFGLSLLLCVFFDVATAAIRGGGEDRATLRFRVAFLVLTGVLYFGPLGIPYQIMLDRYVLSILALVLALGVLASQVAGIRPGRVALTSGWIAAALLGGYAAVTVHDHFAWQRVRWQACNDLMAGKVDGVQVPADQIDGGFEFNNQVANERTLYTTSVDGNLVQDAKTRPYAVAYSERPEFETLRRRTSTVWLPYPPQEILVLRRVLPRP
jgi:hypothetical protein